MRSISWNSAVIVPLWGTGSQITEHDAAGKYLSRRGLSLPINADALRFHPALKYWAEGDDGKPEIVGTPPAMLALISDLSGRGVGIHRIYLDADGRKFDHAGLPAKKLLKAGELHGASVQLSQPDDDRLAVAEGIETAMAFSQLTGVACWSALSTSLMPHVVIPETIKRVYIAVDPDQAGRKAAKALSVRLINDGLAVWLCEPPKGAGDWNDVLMTKGESHA